MLIIFICYCNFIVIFPFILKLYVSTAEINNDEIGAVSDDSPCNDIEDKNISYKDIEDFEDLLIDETLDQTLDKSMNETMDETLDQTLEESMDDALDQTLDESMEETMDETHDTDDSIPEIVELRAWALQHNVQHSTLDK